MPGTINWTITYVGSGPQPVVELYDVSPGADALPDEFDVPCNPPVGCPWPTESLEFGEYKAALRSGTNRYYYVGGVELITAPNDASIATVITLSQSQPSANVKIKVHG